MFPWLLFQPCQNSDRVWYLKTLITCFFPKVQNNFNFNFDIITNKDKNIDLMLANSGHDLKTIGLLGDPHSKRIMFKSLIFIIRDVFYKFEKITNIIWWEFIIFNE